MLESEEDDRKSFEVIAVEKKQNIFQAQKPTRWIALWGGELEQMP